MTLPPIVMRASSLPLFSDCQRRTVSRMFPHQIIECGYTFNETAKSIGAMIGTSVHAAAGWMLQHKIETGEPGNVSDAEDRGVDTLKKERDGADVNYDATTPAIGVGQQQVIRMVRRYRADVVPNANPTSVEEYVTFQTARGNTVSGHLDLNESGPIDLKTGTTQRMNIAQYGTYSMLLRSKGFSSIQVREDYLKRVKIKEEQPPVVSTQYDLNLAEGVSANIIKQIESGYEKFMVNGDPGVFLANPNSVLCGAKFCGCFHTEFCPESKAKAAK